jgi:hypothetical protein
MKKLPTESVSLVNLVLSTFKAYFTIFPHIWLMVALSSAVHLVVPWFFVLNPTYGFVALIGFVLLTWFFYTAILNTAHIALEGGHMKFKAAFRLSRRRYLYILASNVLFFAIGLLLVVVEFGLNLLLDLVHQHPLFVVIIVLINVYIFIRLYFAIPLIALENVPVITAFIQSFKMERHSLWRTFIVLFILGMLVLGFEALGILFTGKDRMVLFTVYHFIMQLIFYPLIISATLLLLNDLKLRRSASHKVVEQNG